ncbi:MAG: hypothetical protein KAX49_13760 [Halanaerobiales bacterium]|nr:hypothetical protein [Halanaerobiales bacterium]
MKDINSKFENLCFYEPNCKKCNLCNNRNNIVVGKGNVLSNIMFVGLGPGKDEDEQGYPL